MKNRWKIWGIHFDLASKKLRVEELEKRLEEPGFGMIRKFPNK